ncbi:hypothetical protein OH77DRAFT_728282 [Trametes cingulata]|nr:hypothetical protein OH77DRAFT_728282 [Trametes cingulata]
MVIFMPKTSSDERLLASASSHVVLMSVSCRAPGFHEGLRGSWTRSFLAFFIVVSCPGYECFVIIRYTERTYCDNCVASKCQSVFRRWMSREARRMRRTYVIAVVVKRSREVCLSDDEVERGERRAWIWCILMIVEWCNAEVESMQAGLVESGPSTPLYLYSKERWLWPTIAMAYARTAATQDVKVCGAVALRRRTMGRATRP